MNKVFFDQLIVSVRLRHVCKETRQSMFLILIQLLAFAVVVYTQYKIPYLKRGKKIRALVVR